MSGIGPELPFFPRKVNVDDLLKLFYDPQQFFMLSQ